MIRAVLFDLDGTLVDSAPDLTVALNHLRDEEGLAPIGVEKLRAAVSSGGAGMLALGMPEVDESGRQALIRRFLDHYERQLFQESLLYQGVNDCLSWLASRGLPWGVVTNKAERFTLPVMRLSGLARGAGCVVCGDTLRQSKPDPAPVALACQLLGASPAETVMLGDDLRDIQAARSAGAVPLYARWGYTEKLAEEDCEQFDSMPAFRDWLAARMEG